METFWLILFLTILLFILFYQYRELSHTKRLLQLIYENIVNEKLSDRLTTRTLQLEENEIKTELSKIEKELQLLLIILQNINRKYAALLSKQQEIDRTVSNKLNTLIGLIGQIAERLTPLLLMLNHNIHPRDLRFLGDPIDYIAFDGLYTNKDLKRILFIEVKYRRKRDLNERQRILKELIQQKKVEWLTISFEEELNKAAHRKLSEYLKPKSSTSNLARS